jgi:hypothetical protein
MLNSIPSKNTMDLLDRIWIPSHTDVVDLPESFKEDVGTCEWRFSAESMLLSRHISAFGKAHPPTTLARGTIPECPTWRLGGKNPTGKPM